MRWLIDPVTWGVFFTTVIVFVAVALGQEELCESQVCETRFAVLLTSKPNEIGDTLAGFVGTLAFIWIIVTVLLQSNELAAQREELRLTRSEMKEQRKATQDMARSLAAQAAIFEDEKKDRAESRAHRSLVRKLEFVRNSIATLAEDHYSAASFMNLIPLNRDDSGERRVRMADDQKLVGAFAPNTEVGEAFFLLAERSKETKVRLTSFVGPRRPLDNIPKEIEQCFLLIEQIIGMKGELSDEDRTYLAVLRVEETRDSWSAILRIIGGNS